MPNWGQVLQEIERERSKHSVQASAAVDTVRRRYLARLHRYTGRNVIAYYSAFLSKPQILQSDINDEDKNGFMMAVHQLDKNLGLDLILHTEGGSISATQSIVDYLHKMFKNNIRAIVPQIAMSAGTMIACSCKSIVLATHSNLGPIDPQLGRHPAYGVISEFERACEEVKNDPDKIPIWQAIIGQYEPAFLGECQNSIDWSNAFVEEQLRNVMFEGEADAHLKATQIVRALTDYTGNKTHERHIHADECEAIGLKVERLEPDQQLQDLVLTVHHSFMHSLMNTPSFKMIENHRGVAFVKQARTTIVPA